MCGILDGVPIQCPIQCWFELRGTAETGNSHAAALHQPQPQPGIGPFWIRLRSFESAASGANSSPRAIPGTTHSTQPKGTSIFDTDNKFFSFCTFYSCVAVEHTPTLTCHSDEDPLRVLFSLLLPPLDSQFKPSTRPEGREIYSNQPFPAVHGRQTTLSLSRDLGNASKDVFFFQLPISPKPPSRFSSLSPPPPQPSSLEVNNTASPPPKL